MDGQQLHQQRLPNLQTPAEERRISRTDVRSLQHLPDKTQASSLDNIWLFVLLGMLLQDTL
jgi:hypothetical protein